jgi:hypothetical protein
MYKKDGLAEEDIASIVDTFPNQGTQLALYLLLHTCFTRKKVIGMRCL